MTPALDLYLFITLVRDDIRAHARKAGIVVIGGRFIPFTKCDELLAHIKDINNHFRSVRAAEIMCNILEETIKKERAAYDNQLER